MDPMHLNNPSRRQSYILNIVLDGYQILIGRSRGRSFNLKKGCISLALLI